MSEKRSLDDAFNDDTIIGSSSSNPFGNPSKKSRISNIAKSPANVKPASREQFAKITVLSIEKINATPVKNWSKTTRTVVILSLHESHIDERGFTFTKIHCNNLEGNFETDIKTKLYDFPGGKKIGKKELYPIKMFRKPFAESNDPRLKELNNLDDTISKYLTVGMVINLDTPFGVTDESPDIGIFELDVTMEANLSNKKDEAETKRVIYSNFKYKKITTVDFGKIKHIDVNKFLSQLGHQAWERDCLLNANGISSHTGLTNAFLMKRTAYSTFFIPLTATDEFVIDEEKRIVKHSDGKLNFIPGIVAIECRDGESGRELYDFNVYCRDYAPKDSEEHRIPFPCLKVVLDSAVVDKEKIQHTIRQFVMMGSMFKNNIDILLNYGLSDDESCNHFFSMLKYVNSSMRVSYVNENPYENLSGESGLNTHAQLIPLSLYIDWKALIDKFGILIDDDGVKYLKVARVLNFKENSFLVGERAKNMSNKHLENDMPFFMNGYSKCFMAKSVEGKTPEGCRLYAMLSPNFQTDFMLEKDLEKEYNEKGIKGTPVFDWVMEEKMSRMSEGGYKEYHNTDKFLERIFGEKVDRKDNVFVHSQLSKIYSQKSTNVLIMVVPKAFDSHQEKNLKINDIVQFPDYKPIKSTESEYIDTPFDYKNFPGYKEWLESKNKKNDDDESIEQIVNTKLENNPLNKNNDESGSDDGDIETETK